MNKHQKLGLEVKKLKYILNLEKPGLLLPKSPSLHSFQTIFRQFAQCIGYTLQHDSCDNFLMSRMLGFIFYPKVEMSSLGLNIGEVVGAYVRVFYMLSQLFAHATPYVIEGDFKPSLC